MDGTMRRGALIVTVAAAVLLLAGCNPTGRIVWSPDGRTMAVLAGDGLRLGDPGGQLSPLLVTDARIASWYPGSRQLLLVSRAQTTNWKEASAVVSAAESKQIAAESEQYLSQLLAFKGDFDDFAKKENVDYLSCPAATIVYLRATHARQLREKLGDNWLQLRDTAATVSTVQTFDVSGHSVSSGPVWCRTLRQIDEVRVCPTGKAALIVETVPARSDGPFRALVMPAPGGQAREIAHLASRYPDWTADGRKIAYVRATDRYAGSDHPHLGELDAMPVCDAEGSVIEESQSAEGLAVVAYTENSRVRCTRDGRIVFSAFDFQLPCTREDAGKNQSLFALEPGRLPTVVRLVPRSQEEKIGDSAEYFEISPGGGRVSIPDESGTVSVLDLGSGEVSRAQKRVAGEHQRIPFIPCWRSDDELCFAAPNEKKQAGEHDWDVVLWSLPKGSGATLSRSWPAEAVRNFLNEPEQQPSP